MDDLKEEWKPVVGYEGLYEVSNFGRVKALEKVRVSGRGYGLIRVYPEKIMKTSDKAIYQKVVLRKDGKEKLKSVHRLVADAFIPNPDNLPQVNHKDENKHNNHVDNLEWCTCRYNVNYGTCNDRRFEKHSKRAVAQYTLDGKLVAIYPSIGKASKSTGINSGGILYCCNGGHFNKSKGIWQNDDSCKGYRWQYVK